MWKVVKNFLKKGSPCIWFVMKFGSGGGKRCWLVMVVKNFGRFWCQRKSSERVVGSEWKRRLCCPCSDKKKKKTEGKQEKWLLLKMMLPKKLGMTLCDYTIVGRKRWKEGGEGGGWKKEGKEEGKRRQGWWGWSSSLRNRRTSLPKMVLQDLSPPPSFFGWPLSSSPLLSDWQWLLKIPDFFSRLPLNLLPLFQLLILLAHRLNQQIIEPTNQTRLRERLRD